MPVEWKTIQLLAPEALLVLANCSSEQVLDAFAGLGGVGAVGLLILGTALGAKTRHDALATS